MNSTVPGSQSFPRAYSLIAAAALGGLTAMVGTAAAQVSGLVIQYQGIYVQNSVNPPGATTANQVSASLSYPSDSQLVVDEVRLAKPSGADVPVSGFDTLYSTSLFTYPTRNALIAAWPSGPYTFTAVVDNDGNYIETAYVLQQPSSAGAWPTAVPAFTPASYTGLQGMNPAQPRTVEVNVFTVSPPANGQLSGLSINQRYGSNTIPGPTVWSNYTLAGSPTATRIIPANALQPGTDYYATWTFDQRLVNPPPVNVEYTHVSFGNLTRVAFRTGAAVICQPDLGVAGGAAGSDGQLDNNDFIAFITHFFNSDPRADLGVSGGLPGSDGQFDNNDFIAFITYFFAGC